MSDVPFHTWMMLGIGAVIVAVIFAPASVWEWVLRQVAREEGKSVEQLQGETRRELQGTLSNLAKGRPYGAHDGDGGGV